MKLTIQEKIILALKECEMTQTELAEKLGISKQLLHRRIKTGKFSDEDFERIASALGCEYRSGFYWDDGKKVD